MRTDMLFGIQFTEKGLLPAVALDYYMWRREIMLSYLADNPTLTKFGTLFGLSPERQLQLAENAFIHNRRDIPPFKDIVKLCEEQQPRQYYMARKVVNMCEEIKISSDFDLGWLTPLKDGIRQLNWGEHLIRYSKQGPNIVAVAVSGFKNLKNIQDFKFTFFGMDLNKKTVTGPVMEGDPMRQGGGFSSKIYHDRCVDTLQRFLVFMELSDIKEVIVPAGKKHGTRKADDNLMNTAKVPVTVVSSNWNKKIIRVGDIEVSSHLRRQRWGPGLTQIRPIIIEEFVKKSYNLKAGKERNINKHNKRPGNG